MSEWKHRHLEIPNSRLLGTVVKVEAVEHCYAAYDVSEDWDTPTCLCLTYADGRVVQLNPLGYEADGIGID